MPEFQKLTDRTVDISSYLPNGVALAEENANKVVVSIQVQQPGTKTFEVSTSSITVNNIAEGYSVNYGSTVDLEIQVKGPSDVLNLFSPAKKVSIDLKYYTEAGTYTVPVKAELPDGCSLVKDVSVEIVLEKTKQNDKTQNENNNSNNSTNNASNENQTDESEKKTETE